MWYLQIVCCCLGSDSSVYAANTMYSTGQSSKGPSNLQMRNAAEGRRIINQLVTNVSSIKYVQWCLCVVESSEICSDVTVQCICIVHLLPNEPKMHSFSAFFMILLEDFICCCLFWQCVVQEWFDSDRKSQGSSNVIFNTAATEFPISALSLINWNVVY